MSAALRNVAELARELERQLTVYIAWRRSAAPIRYIAVAGTYTQWYAGRLQAACQEALSDGRQA